MSSLFLILTRILGVTQAYETLKDPKKRKLYDDELKIRREEKKKGKSKEKKEKKEKEEKLFEPKQRKWGEEFLGGAYGKGDDSEETSESSSGSEGEDDEVPDSFRRNVYKHATQHVNKLLINPFSKDAVDAIEELNNEIKDKNKEQFGDKGKTKFLIPNVRPYVAKRPVVRNTPLLQK